MTDYLEEELERARALLEEVRKMERSVPGRAGAEAETEAPRRDGVAPEMAGALEKGRDAGSGAEGLGQAERGAPAGAETETERRSPPLLEEIARLERAAFTWNALRRERRGPSETGTERGGVRGGYPWALSGPGRDGLLSGGAGGESRDWGWNGVPARGAAPAVDEARWAEWADRAFRRDSRRYDGGFYLY
ncbi:hypothetical protein N510_002571 [Firmicutes bacterium ASF500]|nr:hypothetical protein N510_002571 [Firmicutes bacterium ASF500]